MNKKGLSDVVTTVLIILLVVAAVSAVWVFVQPTLQNAGNAVEKGQVCITSSVSPVTCKFNVANYTISYKRTTDEKVKAVNSAKLTLKKSDGSVTTQDLNVTSLSNGESTYTVVPATGVSQVQIVSEFLLDSGQKQSCTSPDLACN